MNEPDDVPEGPMMYDYDGNPVTDIMEFGRLSMDPRKIVATTEVADRMVSTVWIGTDPMSALRRLRPDDWADLPPLIYETAVFAMDSDDVDIADRYPTRAAALAGHDQVIARLDAERKDEP